MSGNNIDRRDFDLGASTSAQDNFNAVASRLEALIDQRDRDVKAAMSDYLATGVSEEYAANDATAQDTLKKAQAAVDAIG